MMKNVKKKTAMSVSVKLEIHNMDIRVNKAIVDLEISDDVYYSLLNSPDNEIIDFMLSNGDIVFKDYEICNQGELYGFEKERES